MFKIAIVNVLIIYSNFKIVFVNCWFPCKTDKISTIRPQDKALTLLKYHTIDSDVF